MQPLCSSQNLKLLMSSTSNFEYLILVLGYVNEQSLFSLQIQQTGSKDPSNILSKAKCYHLRHFSFSKVILLFTNVLLFLGGDHFQKDTAVI